MGALKSTDYNGVVEGGIVDEIFFQIPEILVIHEEFLESLTRRCNNWDVKFTVGDLFVEAFTKQQVIDTYTAFINNWKCAKDATKIATQAKPAFARFLEHMSREHKGKLALDALLIMPVQRIPRYELLLKELLKHTNMDHPDHHLLVQAQKEVHDLAVKINRVEREAFQLEQMMARVKEIENHIEGVVDLCVPERAFIRHDMVTIPGGLGTKKERCLFLFSDILLITSIKKKSTAMRKPSATPTASPSSQTPFSVLDSNKYKLLTKFSLDSMEISKSNDVSLKRAMRDIATLEEDIHILNQIKELVGKLSSHHQTLEDVVRDLTNGVSKQMLEKQNNDYSLISLEMTVTTQDRVENLTIQFTSPERRAVWSAAFSEAKQRLVISSGRKLPPELKKAMPIRKTRAGLQFTCAAATLGCNQQGMREVWVCNSDGYVGQVCVLSLLPEPTVMSCNGVCNARILTIASIPAACTMISEKSRWKAPATDNTAGVSIEVEEVEEEEEIGAEAANNGNIQLDSDSSDDDDDETESTDEGREERKRGSSIPREEDDMDNKQPTMWLGTEDGCVHVYNCNDNIRTKKNKIKVQHSAAIQCIIYMDNRVFVSIANGEVHIYKKGPEGGWCTNEPDKIQVGTPASPVTLMLSVTGKLWCGCQNVIHILNTSTLEVETSFLVSGEANRLVLCMVTSGLGVWVTVTPSAVIRLFHAMSYEPVLDVNVAPTVAKILSAATDDIIKQHKSACLRVTALLACKDLLWIGTSAGVILTLPLPHLTPTTLAVHDIPEVTGLPHGHTGHVRFLTCVEMNPGIPMDPAGFGKYSFRSSKSKENSNGRRASTSASTGSKLLVISGGDGYEDFSTSGLGEQAGHDDSTNHLLLWNV
ncbi:rho guanine nucleotide exchange factor 17 [Nephila pilipes]|uniref:Rho guanine nucleotide exchange factor 17 n=1 Tax=Nephila pilipes TaxID=299642 RepID=A0A8X6N4U7_NEPPI|nr:rho guanine nucleotide exchange factor 17 [Nephila pilipes]